MVDRPILFSGPMVRAILDGRKTQTRRVIEPCEPAPLVGRGDKPAPNWIMVKVPARHGGFMAGPTFNPRYAPGDRLWVREAHSLVPASAYRGSVGTGTIAQTEHPTDGYSAAVFREGFDRSGEPRWRPSIHMPRWASRLTLTVTDVRVQRLQVISEADAGAEGAPVEELSMYPELGTAQHWFRDLWDSLNADRAPWASNPWVCAVSFTVQHGNIDRLPADVPATKPVILEGVS